MHLSSAIVDMDLIYKSNLTLTLLNLNNKTSTDKCKFIHKIKIFKNSLNQVFKPCFLFKFKTQRIISYLTLKMKTPNKQPFSQRDKCVKKDVVDTSLNLCLIFFNLYILYDICYIYISCDICYIYK